MADEQAQEQIETPQEQQGNPDAKFTQKDLDTLIQKRLAEQEAKFNKMIEEQKAEAAKQAELAQMTEIDRIKAEKEDLAKKYQEEADKNAFALQKDNFAKQLSEQGISRDFLDFLIVPKDETKSKANAESFKKVFDETIKAEVEKKVPSHVPGGGVPQDNTELRKAFGLK